MVLLWLQAAGIKETYFGYDEDDTSVDSEMSSSSRVSSSRMSLDTSLEDEVFDEVRWGQNFTKYLSIQRF